LTITDAIANRYCDGQSAETDQGRGIMGVIDGGKSKGVEDAKGIAWRKNLLRKIGYKL
jgi:adenosine/AMP kinase